MAKKDPALKEDMGSPPMARAKVPLSQLLNTCYSQCGGPEAQDLIDFVDCIGLGSVPDI